MDGSTVRAGHMTNREFEYKDSFSSPTLLSTQLDDEILKIKKERARDVLSKREIRSGWV